jgi:hypothetical protein
VCACPVFCLGRCLPYPASAGAAALCSAGSSYFAAAPLLRCVHLSLVALHLRGPPCLRFDGPLAISVARLEVGMARHSFPVGLLHPLQHARLSRRSSC